MTILPIYKGGIPFLEEFSFIEKCNIVLVPFVGYFHDGINSSLTIKGIIRNVGGNLLLLMPFILYLCAKYEKLRNLKSATITAFSISLCIEFTQLITNILGLSFRRTIHLEDLLLNTLGGIIA